MIKHLMALFMMLSFSVNSYAYWSCAWPYRTAVSVQENTGTTLTDYQVQITITGSDLNAAYDWTSNGFDLRIVDSDDETLLDFWVDSWDQASETATAWIKFDALTANQNRQIYIYYGNEFADQLANVPFTFVEPGIKFHTRRVVTNPSSLTQAQSLFDAASDGNSGYGCTFINDFTRVENSDEFGSNTNFIAYSETYFKVEAGEEGIWGIRYGADFGGGGGLYVDGVALEEQWGDDLWWDNNWGLANEVLEGSIDLDEGFHKLEVIGQEGGNDGGITVQFQRPSGSFISYDVNDIEIVSRACPVSNEPTVTFGAQATATCPTPIAQYRLDGGPWGGTNDVLDETGNFPGTMVGNVTSVDNTQVCSGAQVGSNTTKNDIDIIQTGVDLDNDVGAVGSINFWVRFDQDWNTTGGLTVLESTLAVTGGASDKYFVLTKESDGRLRWRFEDSLDADFNYIEPALSSNRTANTWYHITLNFDYPSDEFSMYVNEDRVIYQTPTTSGLVKDFGYISFGDNNAPLSSAGGSSSNATFDEINIFDATLSISEIRGLMAKTRSCPVAGKQCGTLFPDGLVALDGGDIDFGFDAQLLNNPDSQLSAGNITMNGAPNQFTCGGSNVCVTGDPIVNSVSAGPFQTTASTTDINVPFRDAGEIGSSTNNYRTVNTNFRSTLNVAEGAFSEFFINTLSIGGRNTVNLAPGTYWINNLSIGNRSTINVLSGGPVRLYVNNVTSWNSDVTINSVAGSGSAGSVEELLLYFYDTNVTIGNSVTISGTVYSEGDVTFSSDGKIFGLFAAKNIDLASSSEVTYDEAAYDGLSDIAWCDSSPLGVGSITISSPLTGINCLPSEIDILVFDTNGDQYSDFDGDLDLTTSVAHGDWTVNGSEFGSLDNLTADDGAAVYDMSSSDGGDVTLLLSNTHPESTTLTVESEGVSQSATINFQAAGFIFSNIPTQVSAQTSSSLSIQAVETDQVTGACQALLLDNQTVEMAVECISPSNCGAAIYQVNTSPSPTPVSTNTLNTVNNFSDVTLNFGNATSSTSTFTQTYNEAGSIRLWARYQLLDSSGAATGNTITGISNSFVNRPAGFCIEPTEPNWQCATPGLSASCTAFKQAGDTFNLSVSAKQYSSGSTDYCSHLTTVNFTNSVDLSHNLISPTAVDGGQAGSFSLASINLNSGGVGTSTTASFDDMGVFSLSGGGNTYLAVTLPSNDSENIGRFYPKRFSITSNTAATYDNGNTGFTYTGQLETGGTTGSISYLTAPDFTFEVQGYNNQTLNNYLTPLYSIPVVSVAASSTTQGNVPTAMTLTAGWSAGTITGPDINDRYLYTFNTADHFVFNRTQNSLIAPFNNDTRITVSSFIEPIDSVDIASPEIILGTGGPIYYGRIRIDNAYGPETEPVPQLFKAEYFDGIQFLLNDLDNGSDYDLAGINSMLVTDVGSATNNLGNNDSTISGDIADIGMFVNGEFLSNWSVPVDGRYGSYSFMYTVENWLKYDWNGSADGVNEDPSGTVNFGQFRGNDRVIYWKEINY